MAYLVCEVITGLNMKQTYIHAHMAKDTGTKTSATHIAICRIYSGCVCVCVRVLCTYMNPLPMKAKINLGSLLLSVMVVGHIIHMIYHLSGAAVKHKQLMNTHQQLID